MSSDCSDHSHLAKDCKAFYEKRLQLTRSVKNKWRLEEQNNVNDDADFSTLPGQIAKLRRELLSLAHMDNELFKNLLALNDKLEELKLQRGVASSLDEEEEEEEDNPELGTTDAEYDDEDIDEVADEETFGVYSSLPPSQILERAAALDSSGSSDHSSSSSSGSTNGGGGSLDVMGGLKFMLRSRSFLLRPPFHKKIPSSNHAPAPSAIRTTPRRSRITSADSPFRTFDRIQENRVADDSNLVSKRSQSAERRTQNKKLSKLEAGSSATLTRGFHLPHSSKSLWQRVFVGGGSVNNNHSSFYGGNGPESLPCSWSVVDSLGIEDKSPPPTLKHIKQNSFDSGIHTSDSSEYSIKI